jgi:hypothetical protein
MADYYPLIARAIAGLDPSAPGESRRALYERAQSAPAEQLRSVQPSLSESEITSERLALEDAVRRVEHETADRHREREQQEGAGRTENDPLAELARSIGQTDPFRDLGRTNPPASPSEQSSELDDGLPPGPPSWLRRASERMHSSPEEAVSIQRRVFLPNACRYTLISPPLRSTFSIRSASLVTSNRWLASRSVSQVLI